MEAVVAANDFSGCLPPDDQIGKNTRVADADGRYIEFAKATFTRKKSLKNIRIALDCANGAAWRVAPLIFRELDAEVFVYGASPDGTNINAQCGSLYPALIQKAVIEHKADVGIALDGDADRVIMVDENAQIVDGDTLLAICARDMKQRGVLTHNTVVGTVMSNFGFLKAMEKLEIEVIKAEVGDRYVIQEMLSNGLNLGGEQSGHLIFLDHNTTGDGLVAALQVLRIMVETESRLSDLAAVIRKYPQALLNIKVASKPTLDTLKNVTQTISQVREKLGDSGRVLVRYSGTEAVCRVMVEGPKQAQVKAFAEEIGHVIRAEIGLV